MTIEETLSSLDLDSELVEIKDLTTEDLLDFARHGESEILQIIFESDFSFKLACHDENNTSLLHMAAANGHYECVQLLLKSPEVIKFCLNLLNSEGNSPLHWAALSGQAKIVRLLIEHGADLKSENLVKRTPFDEAVSWEKFDVTSTIIEFLEKSQEQGQEQLDGSEQVVEAEDSNLQ